MTHMNRDVLALGVLTIGLFLPPATASAQIEQVKIAVSGLTCNLCAAGLERSLRSIDDVSGVDVSVADEAAIVRLRSGNSFDPGKFRAAVKNAGQEVRAFELRLSAVVQGENGRYHLQPGRGIPLTVRAGSAEKLKPLVGRTVRARVKVVSLPQSPLELELTDVSTR
jgi:copper chaperone CopZ